MNMYSAEALEFEEQLESRPTRQREQQPSFEVVTGGGLDSRVRAGVSSAFLARVKAVVAAAVLIFVLGSVRVALTAATVSVLSTNATLREQISTFETNNDNLRVERSLLASATRIDRIATQNYGMISPASFDVIVFEPEVEEEVEGEISEESEAVVEDEASAEEAVPEQDAAIASEGFTFDATLLTAGL